MNRQYDFRLAKTLLVRAATLTWGGSLFVRSVGNHAVGAAMTPRTAATEEKFALTKPSFLSMGTER